LCLLKNIKHLSEYEKYSDIRIVLSSIGGYMEITYAKILETMKTFSSEELNRFVSTEEYKTFIGIRKVLQENGYGY